MSSDLFKVAGFYLTNPELIRVSYAMLKKDLDGRFRDDIRDETTFPYAAMHVGNAVKQDRIALALVGVKGTATDPREQFPDRLLVVHIERMDEDGKMTSIPFNLNGPEKRAQEWLNYYELDDRDLEGKYVTLPTPAVPAIRGYPHIYNKFLYD